MAARAILGFLLLITLVGSTRTQAAEPTSASRPETRLTFLGTAAAVPAPGEDVACFIINGTFLVDTGYNVALNMQRYGYDPLKVQTLYFTHLHHDHYMGLPGLLFVRGMRQRELTGRPRLQIVGPNDDLPLVVNLARQFLQVDRFPPVDSPFELRPLEPGKTYETEQFKVETIKALHPVTGFCSRLTDKATGAVIAFSGDTNPNPALAKLARGADVLIHEASVSSATPDEKMGADHSRAIDAARIAKEAKVKQLILIHLHTKQKDAALKAAREIFPNTTVATEGQTIIFTGRLPNGTASAESTR